MGEHLDKLRQHLMSLPNGEVANVGVVEGLLSDAWHELGLSREGGMTADKLVGRMENVHWDPPELSFEIERHGGTVMGSSRAEIQDWTVDVNECLARVGTGRFKQVQPRAKPLDVQPLVEEVGLLIIEGRQDERLSWDGADRVRVNIAIIIPRDGPKQTVEGEVDPRFWTGR
ncbi:MAG: hypothetical protein U5R46_02235 [Gammaproteobacteria bacterium]|nr:hypothetical protein [Gammaproteobacteria bacterium]